MAFYRVNYDKKVDRYYSFALAVMDENGDNYRELTEWKWGDPNSTPLDGPLWQDNNSIIFYEHKIMDVKEKSIASTVSIETGEVKPMSQGWIPPALGGITQKKSIVSPDGWHQLRLFLRLIDDNEVMGKIDLFGPRIQIGLPHSLLARTIYKGVFYNLIVWLPDNRHFTTSIFQNGLYMIAVYDIRGNSVTFQGREFAIQEAYMPTYVKW